ncbi:trypsin-like serine peptidase [Kitasatospora sp. NPDC048365]|uniref:trypsin-like serine peptidase n=1 Tax=Kitasatospora sp. NPDC048365 TaxID=3364050 RepID=UPI0037155D9F
MRMGRHSRGRGLRVLRPVALTSVLAVGLVGITAAATELVTHARAEATARPNTELPVAAPLVPSPSTTPSTTPSATASATGGADDRPVLSGGTGVPTDTRHLATVPSYSPPPELGKTAEAAAGTEADRVGALFDGSVGPGHHFCSASVLDSPGHDLILTAAHCVSSTDGLRFVPGYRDGKAPYGSWKVTAIWTSDGWQNGEDPDEDFAILRVDPNGGREIEDAVGGNPLGLDASRTAQVRLYGYPAKTERPLVCTNATTRQATFQRAIACPGFPGGTSGGPWIEATSGRVIGVIGGYQQGGDTDDISYSAYFDHTVGDLYARATSA